jgi:hypothetical protein
MSDDNPYAAPTKVAGGDPATTDLPRFSRGQALVATFCGSIVAGAFVLRQNYLAEGDRRKGNRVLAGGVAVLAAFVALTWTLDGKADRLANVVATVVSMSAVSMLYTRDLSARFSAHLADGGKRRSHWAVALVVFGCLAALVILAILAGLVMELISPASVDPA